MHGLYALKIERCWNFSTLEKEKSARTYRALRVAFGFYQD